MLTFKNVLMPDGSTQNLTRSSELNQEIDAGGLLALPGLIDAHVHFRVPGMEDKEDWQTGSMAAFKGGVTTVFDMPNTQPTTVTRERLDDKINIINQQLKASKRPLKYKLYFGADKNNFHEIVKVKDDICGIKVFMGSSVGDLLMDDESSLHAIYALAKTHNLIVALHAEDDVIIQNNLAKYKDATEMNCHSIIREPAAAQKAVELVIYLSELYQVTSYVLHVSTKAEIDLIKAAKERGISIYAETCPHYLFFDQEMYRQLQGRIKMNPPVRSPEDRKYLWHALNEGVIDTISSDHAPHSINDKEQPLCKCPSGVPGVETTLPLLLTAWKKGKITLGRILELIHHTPQKMFNLNDNDDLVLVDINNYHLIQDHMMATKSKWSPFIGMNLTGFPKFVYTANQLFTIDCEQNTCKLYT